MLTPPIFFKTSFEDWLSSDYDQVNSFSKTKKTVTNLIEHLRILDGAALQIKIISDEQQEQIWLLSTVLL